MSDNISLSRPARTTIVSKGEIECKKLESKSLMTLSGNTRFNFVKGSIRRIFEFVPYDQFKNIEFIAEGGFSKIYKAIWVDGPIDEYYDSRSNTIVRNNNYTVVLKKLNNSKNITSKELNEFKVYYRILLSNYTTYGISEYFGITQDPITKDMMIIMPYYSSGDLGISRSATESNNDNEKYGIIPYMAPEIFQGQKYTEASDIYSFGMIMWEFMTGRRPFWDEIHDIELIIKICDGL
ncbi:Ypk2p [Rhizophagus irregularis DAOM 197198w]|uniref:Ypk2p n=1 Tax=Rhizophagus irregularis (strain DAOM 197198w) TaxID=1432141 RepID=A0A015K3Q1_RHIIW|nr:Ypk2p [Rhizophagus irregularis DAOM 197198w]